MSQTVPPILSVLPIRALVDEKFKVLVENLPPGSPVTVRSLHHSEDRDYWEAYGHFISDHRGTVSGGFWSSFCQVLLKLVVVFFFVINEKCRKRDSKTNKIDL